VALIVLPLSMTNTPIRSSTAQMGLLDRMDT